MPLLYTQEQYYICLLCSSVFLAISLIVARPAGESIVNVTHLDIRSSAGCVVNTLEDQRQKERESLCSPQDKTRHSCLTHGLKPVYHLFERLVVTELVMCPHSSVKTGNVAALAFPQTSAPRLLRASFGFREQFGAARGHVCVWRYL